MNGVVSVKVKNKKKKQSSLSLIDNESPRRKIEKRRKKKKSVIYQPNKFVRSKSSQSSNSSIQRYISDEYFSSLHFPLKPSTSETSIEEQNCMREVHRSDSEISVSLNEQNSVCSNNNSNFDVYLRGLKQNTNTILDEISENSESEANNSYAGDVNELICDDTFQSKSCGVFNRIMTSSTSKYSDDSFEIRMNDIIENEDNLNETDSDLSAPEFDLFEIDTKYVVILKHSQILKVFGYCDLKILYGNVNVLGYNFNKKLPEQTVFSPRGTALLTLKNTSTPCDKTRTVKILVPQLAKQSKIKDVPVRKDSNIVMFSKKYDHKLTFIENHISQWILPKKDVFPCIEIEPKGLWNMISIPQEWDEIVNNITTSSKVFICGGKGVGKSTFLRYAINCLLQRHEKIRVVDLDAGQSEFTVPGTISVVSVTKPVLGPNYTHLQEADRSILCDINVSQDPNKYVKCVEELLKSENAVHENNFPTLINYMGYTSDIAFHLFSNCVAMSQPSEVIYIESNNRKKNFKIRMNKETISEHLKLISPTLNVNLGMKIIQIPSETDNNTGWSLEPRQMREMCILAYFGQGISEPVNSLQDYRMPMFEIDLREISITDRNNVKVSAEAIDANIVALCILIMEDSAIFECIGWGVVRAVDYTTNMATIITPIDENALEKVTHIVAGCLTLPPSVYMNNEHVQGHVPFVMEGELIDFAQLSKRSHIPGNNKRNI